MSFDPAEKRGGWTTDEVDRLYGAHRLPLVRLAVLLVDDLVAAEDAVQDAFADFLSRSRSLPDPDEALGYLRTSVVGHARSAARRRRADQAYVAPRADVSGHHRQVLDALGRLPARPREVLVLSRWSDLTEVQVADVLGTSRGTVVAALGRGLAALGPGEEELLDAALRARAESVGAEDLRPLGLPDPAPRSRRALLLGVAGAAVAALLAAPFLAGEPEPVPVPEPVRDPEGAIRMDVNGDGDVDVVHVDFNPSARFWTLNVNVTGGKTLTHQGLALNRPTLLPQVDIDGDSAAEVAVLVGDEPGTLPEFFRFVDGNLRRLRPPPSVQDYNGWVMASPLNQFALRGGRLYSWQDDPARSGERQVTGFWQWEIRGRDALVPGIRQQRCLEPGNAFPTECNFLPEEERQAADADVDGDGVPDRATLVFTASHDQDTVAGFDVEVELDGTTWTARGRSGWRPRLVGPVRLAGDARQQVVVSQQNSDIEALVLFGEVDGTLARLEPPGEPLLGAGVDSRARRMQYRMSENRLVSFTILDDKRGGGRFPAEAWEWRVEGAALVPLALGEQCVDPGARNLPSPC